MPDFRLEDAAGGIAIGVDEAGRGPWAGPVSVAACWLDRTRPDQIPEGLDDSKKLTAARRADIFREFCNFFRASWAQNLRDPDAGRFLFRI